jgi:teichuronic acid exporter
MLAVTVPIGIYAMALGVIVTGIIARSSMRIPTSYCSITVSPNSGETSCRPLSSLWSCVERAYSVLFLGLSAWATLVLQIVVGVVVYVGLAWVVGLESLEYVLNTVREYFPGRKGAY